MLAVAALWLLRVHPSCFTGLRVGMIYLCGLLRPPACANMFYLPAGSMVVPVSVLFCHCPVCDRFLVSGAGCVDVGADANLLLRTVAAGTSGGMLLLGVSVTGR